MKRLAVLNLIQLVTTRKRPKGTTYIHVNLINHYCVEKCVLSGSILRKKTTTTKKRTYFTEGTGEIFCDCIRFLGLR